MEPPAEQLGNSQPAGTSSRRSPLAAKAAALLNRRCKVQVKDGRVLVGEFSCIDKQGNIILSNTYEELTTDGRVQEKAMGQVLIPMAHRVTCEIVVRGSGPCRPKKKAYLASSSRRNNGY